MTEELLALQSRIARLEAKEACLSTFNEYLHYLDGEMIDALMALFAPGAKVEAMNYPPGTGEDRICRGHEEILPLYAEHKGIMSRHHAANITINVNLDDMTADLSAYLLTAINYGLTGGIYEAAFKQLDGKWRITWLRIASDWGWIIPQEYPPFLADTLGARALRKGKPVAYEI